VKELFTMDYDYDGGAGAALAFLLILLPLVLIFVLAGYIIGSFFLMKIFEKAGVQGKWRAWVPVYNWMVFAKLGDLSPWVMLGAFVVSAILGQVPVLGWLLSLASLAALVLAGWRVGLKLDKEWYYLLLWLIPGVGGLIWLGILAFGQARWNSAIAPAPWAGNGFLADRTTWDGVPAQVSGGTAGYAGPPAGYTPPPAPGYTPPPAPGYAPPPAGSTPPPASPEPPATPEPPASPDGPPAPPRS
jgi:hypothetical protein